jgi:hypothetical protein
MRAPKFTPRLVIATFLANGLVFRIPFSVTILDVTNGIEHFANFIL